MGVRASVRKFAVALSLTALVITLHTFFYWSSAAARLDYLLSDYWFRLRGSHAAPDEVVLIAMNESSYQVLGIPYNQAWPRALHARLLEKLRAAGVKRVVFDVLFLGAGGNPEADQNLAQAFSQVPTVIGADEGKLDTQYGSTFELLLPYEKFREHADIGLVALPEEEGYVRHFRLPQTSQGNSGELLPLAFAAAKGLQAIPSARDLLNFYGPAGHLKSYSYYQLLEDAVPFPLEQLRNKIVFVGLELRSDVGPEKKDSFLTSYSGNGRHFGVEIHATATANLIQQNWIKRLSALTETVLLGLLLGAICIICMSLGPLRSGLFSLLLILGWLIGSFIMFQYNWFIPGLTVVVVFAPLVYIISTLLFYVITRRSQRQLRRAFELYLSPHMARLVARNPEALHLGGQKVFATALFTDIAGFTSTSESMTAEAVTQMLNDYFTEVVDCVFDQEGTLIKFIGDAVFALWGAPVELELHAQAALEAGLAIQTRLQQAQSLKSYPKLLTRIGVHSGPMVVGNLGSRRRFDFTAIGDSVNIASRIEGLNKYLGTSILLTEAVKSQLTKSFDLIAMGKFRVVGKSEGLELYTVLKVTPVILDLWTRARSYFSDRMWDQSEVQFKQCATQCPQLERACLFYLQQLSHHRDLAPGPDWRGELQLDSK